MIHGTRLAALMLIIPAVCGCPWACAADKIILDTTSRVETPDGNFAVVTEQFCWSASETAVIICDMWDRHWCASASKRVAEIAPRVDDFVRKARARGALIVHAPSDTMDYYKDHPARKRAQNAPNASNLPSEIARGCRGLESERKADWPLDQSDGGCDCQPKCKGGKLWRKQIDAIHIGDSDAVADSGVEIWNLFEHRGIKNVMLVGVHTNMCVVGRPFGLRNMVRFGKNVVLLRDLTDTMYNPVMRPYVNHFTGTDLVVEHIEKFICPTITSTALTGLPCFRFKEDKRPRVVFIIAEDEYDSNRTLPAFARDLQTKYDFACEFALGVPTSQKPERRNYIAGLETLKTADLAVIYVRRRALPAAQMEYLREYIADAKPVVALRTASHAFSLRGEKLQSGFAHWPEFDRDVLGGNYSGHHGNKDQAGPQTYVWILPGKQSHPVLAGVPEGEFRVRSWLYKTSPLADSADVLMMGRVEERKPHEPVAWTSRNSGGGRVFYTSLGHPDDFELPAFRRLLLNAVFWVLDKSLPATQSNPKPAGPNTETGL